MTSRSELVARVSELVDALSASGQMIPREFVLETDLTLPQIRIVYMLARGPARITDISKVNGMALANASSMVERLVGKDLVERVSDPNDRRVTLARLTDKGREVVDSVTRSENTVVGRITDVLSNGELEVVARALDILNEGAKLLESAEKDEVIPRDED